MLVGCAVHGHPTLLREIPPGHNSHSRRLSGICISNSHGTSKLRDASYCRILFSSEDGRCRQKPQEALVVAMICSSLGFVVALLYQSEVASDIVRRITSFVLFMSMVAFMFVSSDDEMIEAFKVSIVTISVFFSRQSIYVFSTSGGASLGFEAKNIVGSQRYGFIYLMAFWILY